MTDTANFAPPQAALLEASASWRNIDFISDLHLCETQPATFIAWRRYMERTNADAVFILGDWFELWVGDDAATSAGALPSRHEGLGFLERCARVMRFASERMSLFVMHGNRDFLLGPEYLGSCNATLLADPTVLSAFGRRMLLTHGDALCLADVDYQRFRQQVRSPAWQRDFLAKPLPERMELARQMREQSMAGQTQRRLAHADLMTDGAADVDAGAARAWLDAAQCQTMLHGHTHRPAVHELPGTQQSPAVAQRWVTSDWDAGARPPRVEALRWSAQGMARVNWAVELSL